MKLFIVPLLLLALTVVGCDDIISVENPYDLRVQIWDRRTNGPYIGAFVTVLETDDGDDTGADGWTETLKTPVNASRVTIVIEWYDLHGFVHSSRPSGVTMRHQVVTEVRRYVDSTPYR